MINQIEILDIWEQYKEDFLDIKRGIGVPPETCPNIDKCLKDYEDMLTLISMLRERACDKQYAGVCEDLSQAQKQLTEMKVTMDSLRHANSALRELGRQYYWTAKGLLTSMAMHFEGDTDWWEQFDDC